MPLHPKDEVLQDLLAFAPRIFIIGNGGSYANTMHIANDLLACGEAAFTMDPATLTAFANDYGYEYAFARWLSIVAEDGDLLIALSGSGKSPNILNACERAKEIGMRVHCVFGAERGQNMQEAEEYQIHMGHELRRLLNERT